MTNEEKDRNAVREAALRMDEWASGWELRVDPLALDQQDSDKCICGQSGLDWSERSKEFRERGGDTGAAIFSGRWMEPYWLEEIAKRMPSTVVEPDRERVAS
jgi:hypothetical protein